jgi:hypothetical protein
MLGQDSPPLTDIWTMVLRNPNQMAYFRANPVWLHLGEGDFYLTVTPYPFSICCWKLPVTNNFLLEVIILPLA